MSTTPQNLPVRAARGPEQGNSYAHSYCPNCNKLIYSLNTYGPMTPWQQNRTFCTCNGRASAMTKQFKTTYDLEDVMSKEAAQKERDAQNKPEYIEPTKPTERPKF